MRFSQAFAALLTVLGCACGSVAHEAADAQVVADVAVPGPDAPVGVAPTVIETTPVDQAGGVEPDVTITATFSSDLDPATVDPTTFLVTQQGVAVAGQVTYDEGTRTATFRPNRRFALLAGGTATVTTGITGANGLPLEAPHTWSFTVRDGVWETATQIETGPGDTSCCSSTGVGMDDRGNAVAVWRYSDAGGNQIVWAGRFDAAGGWGAPEPISLAGGNAAEPRIGVDSAGNAVVLMEDQNAGGLLTNRFVAGTGWTGPTTVAGSLGAALTGNNLAVDAAGNAFAAVMVYDGASWNMHGLRFGGTSWGAPALLETGAGPASTGWIAATPGGDAMTVWLQSDGTRYNVWANRFTSGSWGTASPVETNDGEVAYPRVVMDSDGNALVVWMQVDGQYGIWANRHVPGVGWGTATQLDSNTAHAHSAEIAIDSDGNAVVAWEQDSAPGANDIWTNRFVFGGGWEGPVLLEPSSADSWVVGVLTDALGNTLVMWMMPFGSEFQLFANRFVPASGWSPATLAATVRDNLDPAVAISPIGTATVTWWDQDPIIDIGHVWAATFR